ncbi:MAG: exodeoxyribonuclease III [Mycobacteriales bacterium]
MRLATWNVNSVNARLPRLLDWLARVSPDVCCLQETKSADAAFPTAQVGQLGYVVAHHGDGRWNGVAILSRVGLDDVRRGLLADPLGDAAEARCVAATCAGLRVYSVYVPNGRALDDPQYPYKLAWLASLQQALATAHGPADRVVVCGDFNVAPSDADVWDPVLFVGSTHVSAAERAALAALTALGLRDVVRDRHPEPEPVYTYWDYRAGAFHRRMGMRIDLVLASEPVAAGVRDVYVDREARKGKGPSDHAPVVVDLDCRRHGRRGSTSRS